MSEQTAEGPKHREKVPEDLPESRWWDVAGIALLCVIVAAPFLWPVIGGLYLLIGMVMFPGAAVLIGKFVLWPLWGAFHAVRKL